MTDTYVPFKDREEWKDVVPLPQIEGPNPVCSIAYTAEFEDTMNYFRAILQLDEHSERALSLTEEVINLNPANYTAWYFRRLVLFAIGSDLKEELKKTEAICEENPKNYQVWYHRRALVERMNDPSFELPFSGYILADVDEDGKNYHAWAHRQWVLLTYKQWDGELEFTEKMLTNDFRNNSAWNHRFFVISNSAPVTPEIVSREIEFAFSYIQKAPNNQSPWNYLRGLLKANSPDKRYKFEEYPQVKEQTLAWQEKFPFCPNVYSLLLEIYELENTPESTNKAIEMCEKLASGLDVLHGKYWTYRRIQLQKRLQTE